MHIFQNDFDDEKHKTRLTRLAEIGVKIGVGLSVGQELIITSPVDAIALAREVAEQAYRAGASLVTTIFTDEQSELLRYRFAKSKAFDKAPAWLFDGMAAAYKSGAARLTIRGENPSLLAGQDPKKVSRANRAQWSASVAARELIVGFATNWCIIPAATPTWAKAVFPNDVIETAVARLWEAIFKVTRLDAADPIVAWRAHDRELRGRAAFLNEKRYEALSFRAPKTDLTIGLANGHEWRGGSARTRNGHVCIANIPTEEIYTTPHRDLVEGYVSSTKPLSYNGTLIEDIRLRFEAGRVVDAHARTGETIFFELLKTDAGAAQLGEVALVPESSPIAQSGILFYDTLFDENASSHVAFGQAYKCFAEGTTMSEDELRARGANRSLIHVDWMLGSKEMDVDGLSKDGRCEPVMRGGEWAFTLPRR